MLEKKERRRDRVRRILLERSTEVTTQEGYLSFIAIAHQLERDYEPVAHDLSQSTYPIYRLLYHSKWIFALTQADGEAFIAQWREKHQEPQIKPRKTWKNPIGAADKCGACGTTRGNILALHDSDHRVRAYLCSPCYRVATSYKWEPQRMRNMARVIEAVGLEHLQS